VCLKNITTFDITAECCDMCYHSSQVSYWVLAPQSVRVAPTEYMVWCCMNEIFTNDHTRKWDNYNTQSSNEKCSIINSESTLPQSPPSHHQKMTMAASMKGKENKVLIIFFAWLLNGISQYLITKSTTKTVVCILDT
jgi:hypothetical protein